MPADGVRARQENAIKNHKQWGRSFLEVGGGVCVCVCVMSAYLSLSPLLHFVLKFSIQKIKGGEKTSERAGRGREEEKKKKCHHGFHLESSANLPNRHQSPPPLPP